MKQQYSILIPVLLFIVLHPCIVSAQKNFTEGYIITLKKDTVKGKIDNREWTLNPASIHFEDMEGNKSNFKPDDIKEFFIPPNDHYVSNHVSLDLTSEAARDLMEKQKPRSVEDTALFLLTMVKGKTSLFYIKDQDNREHFYISKEGPPIELLVKKSFRSTSELRTEPHGYAVTIDFFKGQLSVLLNDCPSLKKNIDQAEYSSTDLVALIVKYNQCQNSASEFVKKSEPIRVKFGLLAGPTLAMVSYKGTGMDLSGVKMTDCYSYIAGITLHIIFPRERAQWSLVNELVYKPFSNSGSKSGTQMSFTDYTKTFSFDLGYVKLYNILRYQYPNWKIRPFADLGMSNGYAVKSKNTETSLYNDLGTYTQKTTPAFDYPRLYEFGVTGGIGVSLWKVTGEIRYEWATGLSPYPYIKGDEHTIYFVFSFLF